MKFIDDPPFNDTHVVSEELARRMAAAMPRTIGWSRPGADDERRQVSWLAMPASWRARRSQLRAQRRIFTGFPFHPAVAGGTFAGAGLGAAARALSIPALSG